MTITDSAERLDELPADSSAAPGQGRDAGLTRPTFTITEAATVCAVSRKTITRKLPDLADHGAAKDLDGVWRIPVEALLAVGLHPGRSVVQGPRPQPIPVAAVPQTAQATGDDQARELVTVPRDRWDDLRIRLAKAEAEASERALALADARLALRALTAGPRRSEMLPISSERPAAVSTDPIGSVPAVEGVAHGGPGSSGSSPLLSATTSPWDRPMAEAQEPTAIQPEPARPAEPLVTDLASARSEAAQRGGYVPPLGAPARRRRWWQAK